MNRETMSGGEQEKEFDEREERSEFVQGEEDREIGDTGDDLAIDERHALEALNESGPDDPGHMEKLQNWWEVRLRRAQGSGRLPELKRFSRREPGSYYEEVPDDLKRDVEQKMLALILSKKGISDSLVAMASGDDRYGFNTVFPGMQEEARQLLFVRIEKMDVADQASILSAIEKKVGEKYANVSDEMVRDAHTRLAEING